jgi:hypothetical protein
MKTKIMIYNNTCGHFIGKQRQLCVVGCEQCKASKSEKKPFSTKMSRKILINRYR